MPGLFILAMIGCLILSFDMLFRFFKNETFIVVLIGNILITLAGLSEFTNKNEKATAIAVTIFVLYPMIFWNAFHRFKTSDKK